MVNQAINCMLTNSTVADGDKLKPCVSGLYPNTALAVQMKLSLIGRDYSVWHWLAPHPNYAKSQVASTGVI